MNLKLNSLVVATLVCGSLGNVISTHAGSLAPAARTIAKPARSSPLPVLLVIADQRDFHYKEYADTRRSLELAGVAVQVAATTTARSIPHVGSGQPAGTDGGVVPDVALVSVVPSKYSAIAFVGGWGSSMYQYAYTDPNLDGTLDNYYADALYNGDSDLGDGRISDAKVVVNRLIGAFLAGGKPVAGICHGTTVLAWARVDGVSPITNHRVSVPFIGSLHHGARQRRPGPQRSAQLFEGARQAQHAQVVVATAGDLQPDRAAVGAVARRHAGRGLFAHVAGQREADVVHRVRRVVVRHGPFGRETGHR